MAVKRYREYTLGMTREIPPYGLRMPPELRDRVEREAALSGRSMNAEIVARLWASLDDKRGQEVAPVMKQEIGTYGLNEPERNMLSLFRRWSAEKQLSFLVLFK